MKKQILGWVLILMMGCHGEYESQELSVSDRVEMLIARNYEMADEFDEKANEMQTQLDARRSANPEGDFSSNEEMIAWLRGEAQRIRDNILEVEIDSHYRRAEGLDEIADDWQETLDMWRRGDPNGDYSSTETKIADLREEACELRDQARKLEEDLQRE
ncbi:hypothetical protein PVA45_05880 [Entomospira entomophila]|uniref:Uncharacterized protein n=1 Tax=Entomospira entomophila TaxID=2719988 RepID=A0A968KT38_9SPIO|nr:hypothetical protein [Entomospira entomophilus]NIZ41027.1 hypothetical protein [Entomospira entomophilus]WDI35239.1 hypothetical protein PVA45_05880 [Entomospira entomophilus]